MTKCKVSTGGEVSDVLRGAAVRYAEAGLVAIPAMRDGSAKRPLVKWRGIGAGEWTEEHADALFRSVKSANSIALVCGPKSGGLLAIDFDDAGSAFEAWRVAVEAECPGLLDRLVVQHTPSGGRHVLLRTLPTGAFPQNERLASRGESVLIETRGEGGIVLCAPSDGYAVTSGDLSTIATVTKPELDAMMAAARSLDERFAGPQRGAPRSVAVDDRPGDDFNRHGDIRPVLERNGWKRTKGGDNEHWSRPGKGGGTSATLKDGCFYVFSTSVPEFEANRAYAPFHVLAALEHGGDHAAAARALRADGFGAPATVADEPEDVAAESEARQAPTAVPESMLYLPGLGERVIEHIMAVAPRPSRTLSFVAALALLSTVTGRKLRNKTNLRTNLFLLSLAPSGAGKDKPREVLQEILHAAGRPEWLLSEITSGPALEDAALLSPVMLWQQDEVHRMLAQTADGEGYQRSRLETMLKMFSSAGQTFLCRQRSTAGARTREEARREGINQPHLVLHGTGTVRGFMEALSLNMQRDGFLGRVVPFICERRPKAVDSEWREVPKGLLEAVGAWVRFNPGGGNLHEQNPVPALVEVESAAQKLFDEMHEFCDLRSDECGRRGAFTAQDVWPRVGLHAHKFAMLRMASRAEPREIEAGRFCVAKEDAEWAADLVRLQTEWMLHELGEHYAETPFQRNAQRVLQAVRAAGEISRSGLERSVRHITVRQLDEVLEKLLASGELLSHFFPTKGRPRQVYTCPGGGSRGKK